jgi:hypothetical protein
MVSVMSIYCYAQCHYAECHYAKCCYAECYYAECQGAQGIPMFPSSFANLKFLKEEPKSHSYGIKERESKKETKRASNGSKNVASIKLKKNFLDKF